MTNAVYFEVVTSLNAETFLAALRRFIARRGKPKTIYSDNGTNVQGVPNQLLYMFQSSSQMARVKDLLASERCDWKFIPPHGLHFGGL
jgi:transposase InsO family protein